MTKNAHKKDISRRNFLAKMGGIGAAACLPTLVPGRVLGKAAPSNKIALGCIGVGRMGQGDMRSFMGFDQVRVVAVCDVDSKRMDDAMNTVNKKYEDKSCKAIGDYRELVNQDDIDAVSIVTPDHWHALPALAAARAGKDIFLQKPLTLTIEEGRTLSDTISRFGRVLQVGSQQRSEQNFRLGCELVRNGRIGELHTVKVGLATDPSCGIEPDMEVPKNLNYDMWLGPAPLKPYTEKRVHPQKDYSRPGWLRIMDYGHGMITGWGAHHLDIAQWGMGTELTGPVEIEGEAIYPTAGLWDVHGPFSIKYKYANGVNVLCRDNNKFTQGVRFEGSKGWVFVARGKIDAEPKSLLTSTIGPNEIHLYKSNNHKGNFLDCIKTRGKTVAPVEVGHRSCSVCLLGSIAMQLKRKLQWEPDKEEFIGDMEANRMRSRPMRPPWKL